VSISWGLEVLAPAHIVMGLENSQDKKAHIYASPKIKGGYFLSPSISLRPP